MSSGTGHHRPGRVPIGGRHNVSVAVSTKAEIRLLADRFGQRRFGAIVRIAVRRLLIASSDEDFPALLPKPRAFDSEMTVVPVFLGDDLTSELTELAGRLSSSRAELVRVACDRLLAEQASNLLNGVEVDLTDEVNAEVYRGIDNRDALIRRRMRAQTKSQR